MGGAASLRWLFTSGPGSGRALVSADAGPGVGVPVEGAGLFREGRLGHLADGDSVLPVGRTDGDEEGISAGAALELRVANRHERAGLGDLVEVRHGLGLRVAVGEEPALAL